MAGPVQLAIAILFFFGSILAEVRAADVLFHANSQVHFATESEGRELLGQRDRFVAALSPFDRQSRVETDREIAEAEFLTFVQSHVRPWTADESAKLSAALESLCQRLAPLRPLFPKSVWLIKTSGREEGNAAYCRQHAIVLPQSKLGDPPAELERLLAHELFHILSSHDAKRRAALYQIIGFRVVTPIEPPPSLAALKITNPDGPLLDALIDVQLDGAARTAVPVLYSSAERFDPKQGGPFFKYLTFQLLVLEADGDGWRPAQRDGKPWLVKPQTTVDFMSQIGGNTGYIIHPDEVLADNFVHLLFSTKSLRTPRIVDAMRLALAAE